MYGGTYLCRGLWLRFYYLGKRENDFTILAGREYDFYERVYVDSSSLSENQKIDIRNAVRTDAVRTMRSEIRSEMRAAFTL